MATATWSWSGDQYITDGSTLTLSGTAINKVIKVNNVKYSLQGRHPGVTSTQNYVFNIHSISIKNGPYSGITYNNDFDTATIGTISAKTKTSGQSSESAAATTDFDSGVAKVWRSGTSSTFLKLISCYFRNNINSSSAFNTSSLSVKIHISDTWSNPRFALSNLSITVEYDEVILTSPSSFSISQNSGNGYYSASWTAASLTPSNVGTVTYTLQWYSTHDGWLEVQSGITGTSVSSKTPLGYGRSYTFRVKASFSTLTTYSNEVTIEFIAPTLKSTATTVNPPSGDSVTVSIDPALTITYGQPQSGATYKYSLYYSLGEDILCGNLYEEKSVTWGTLPSITLTSQDIESKIQPADGEKINFCFEFDIPISSPSLQTLHDSSAVYYFTYDGKYTVGYNDGTKWQACVVYYNDGNSWIECIPYYNDGSAWQPIKTKV